MLSRLYLLRKFVLCSPFCLADSISVSAILTIFQVPNAADDPVTRTLALLSLISALFSLSYGCMYIVRFGMMRSMFHASRWAEVRFRRHVYFCRVCSYHVLASAEDEDTDMVERLGPVGDARRLDGMVCDFLYDRRIH